MHVMVFMMSREWSSHMMRSMCWAVSGSMMRGMSRSSFMSEMERFMSWSRSRTKSGHMVYRMNWRWSGAKRSHMVHWMDWRWGWAKSGHMVHWMDWRRSCKYTRSIMRNHWYWGRFINWGRMMAWSRLIKWGVWDNMFNWMRMWWRCSMFQKLLAIMT